MPVIPLVWGFIQFECIICLLTSQFTLCCCLRQCFYVSSYIEASVTTNLAHLLWGYGMKLIFIWFLSEFYLIFIWFFTDFFEWRTTLYLIFIWFFRETQNNVIWFLSEFFLIFLETENNVIWFLSEFYLIFSSSEQNAHVDSGTPVHPHSRQTPPPLRPDSIH